MTALARAMLTLPQARFDGVVADESVLRSPLPVICRVGFVALQSRTGCTSAAQRTAESLAVRREQPLLFVGATPSAPREIRGVVVRSLTPPSWPDAVARWNAEFAFAQREHELTITDWGAVPVSDVLDVAGHSQVTCISTTTDRVAVQGALDVAAELQRRGHASVVVASALTGPARWGTRRMIASLPVDATLLPFDPTHRRDPGRRPAAATQLAATQLAATVIRAATREVPAGVFG